jgi:sigma-B regulation protein RsbU (phosphoserine phosphatase)
MDKPINILHLEDDDNDAELIFTKIKLNFDIGNFYRTFYENEFRDLLSSKKIDIILADYNMPQFNGVEALKIAKQSHPEIPFIIISGTAGEYTAVETMKMGAADYIMKNNLSLLMPAIKRALKEYEAIKEKNEDIREMTNIFEYLDEIIFSVDVINKEILQISPACERITGYSQDEFYNDFNLLNEIIAEKGKSIISENDKMFGKDKPVSYKNKIARKDGTIRLVDSKIKPVFDTSGKLVRYYGFISDISENR